MKRILFIIALVMSALVIHSLVSSIATLWEKQDLIRKAASELAHEKQENERLKKELTATSDPRFVEEQARNKLMLLKAGEHEILLSPSLVVHEKGKATSSSQALPSWQQWLRLFMSS